MAGLPSELRDLPADRMTLVVNDIKNMVSGNIVSSDNPALRAAAAHYENLTTISHAALAVVVLITIVASAGGILWSIKPKLRARNQVELVIKGLMIVCSTIAIFTTLGIVSFGLI